MSESLINTNQSSASLRLTFNTESEKEDWIDSVRSNLGRLNKGLSPEFDSNQDGFSADSLGSADAMSSHSQLNMPPLIKITPSDSKIISPKKLTESIGYKIVFKTQRVLNLGLATLWKRGLRKMFDKEDVSSRVFNCYVIKDNQNNLMFEIYPLDPGNLFVDIKLPNNPDSYAIRAMARLQAEHLDYLNESDAMIGLSILDESFDVDFYNECIQTYQNEYQESLRKAEAGLEKKTNRPFIA